MDDIFHFERNAEDDLYAILGCDETSTMEQILAEYKLKALDLHPDKNLNDETSILRFQRLLKAKEILCDEEQRKSYDKWRNSGMALSFVQWSNLSKTAHTSMHWATKKQKEPMLPCSVGGQSDIPGPDQKPSEENHERSVQGNCSPRWRRDSDNSSSLLNKFRNYQI